MNLLPFFIVALVGMGISVLLVPLILGQCKRTRFLVRAADIHHTRSEPIPRFGGVALALAFLGVEALLFFAMPGQRAEMAGWNAIVLASIAMFVLGLWDDLWGLGARKKLLGQILIAAALCWSGIVVETLRIPLIGHRIELHEFGVLITIFWLVGMTNLINLLDGADGLAGGICLMLMVLLAVLGHQIGGIQLSAAGMAGALLGFLRYNFPPARIYLGDGGAYLLGFQIAAFSLVDSRKGEVFAALSAPLFVLVLPILDTTLAILRRAVWGLSVFRADRRHLHHRARANRLLEAQGRPVLLWRHPGVPGSGLRLNLVAGRMAAGIARHRRPRPYPLRREPEFQPRVVQCGACVGQFAQNAQGNQVCPEPYALARDQRLTVRNTG